LYYRQIDITFMKQILDGELVHLVLLSLFIGISQYSKGQITFGLYFVVTIIFVVKYLKFYIGISEGKSIFQFRSMSEVIFTKIL